MIPIVAQQPASDVIFEFEPTFTSNGAVSGVLLLVGALVAVLLVLITPLVLQAFVIARPWLTPGRLADRLRIGWAVYRYEFWLGLADVPSRRRRELRHELHANLVEAAARTGSHQAVDALGSLRVLAAGSKAPAARRQPPWNTAMIVGIVVFTVLMVAQILLSAGFIAGVAASDVGHAVRGAVGLPGYTVEYVSQPNGFEYGLEGGPSILVLPVIAFVVAARPWRLLRDRA